MNDQVLKQALQEIAALKGKTLLSRNHGPDYQQGANDAFGEAAWIAESALDSFEKDTAS